jgi:hypothetical protein
VRIITEAIRERLAMKVEDYLAPGEVEKLPLRLHKLTVAELIADRFIRAALGSDSSGTRQYRELMDRIEGRVPLPLTSPEGGEFVLNLISHIPRPDRSKTAEK